MESEVRVVNISGDVIIQFDLLQFQKVGDLRAALSSSTGASADLLAGASLLTDDQLISEVLLNAGTQTLTLMNKNKSYTVRANTGAFSYRKADMFDRHWFYWFLVDNGCLWIDSIDEAASLHDLLLAIVEKIDSDPNLKCMFNNEVTRAVVARDLDFLKKYVRFARHEETYDSRGSSGIPWKKLGLVPVTELDTHKVRQLEDLGRSDASKEDAGNEPSSEKKACVLFTLSAPEEFPGTPCCCLH